jgi:hypothetical protein
VGVVDSSGRHVVISSGPLPEAVAASAAIPFVFAAVDIPGKYVRIADCICSQTLLFCWHSYARNGHRRASVVNSRHPPDPAESLPAIAPGDLAKSWSALSCSSSPMEAFCSGKPGWVDIRVLELHQDPYRLGCIGQQMKQNVLMTVVMDW